MSSESTLEALQQLMAIVAQLRNPEGGCPWDLAQTPQSLIPHIIEEAYEVVDALHSQDSYAIAEELGDLLLQVVLQAQIASEQQAFTLKEVAQGISEKLIRRHPHVFGDLEVQDVQEVRHNWEQIKAAEKNLASLSLAKKLHTYARSLPPLMASAKISVKAAQAGLEWDSVAGVWEKFHEELGELQEALATEDRAHQQSELGDVLFTLINIARWYDLDASIALQETNLKFIQRLAQVEALATKPLSEYALEELEAFWQ
jgi:XTP/dITP diphosphohydrolase